MSKENQYDYALLNKAIYNPNPQSVLDSTNRGSKFTILEERTNDMIVRNNQNGKIIQVIKGTDISDIKGQRTADLLQDVGIALGKKEMVTRVKEQERITDRLIKKYGKENVVITAHSLGSYIGEQIANDTGVEAELFNIGSSPLRQNKVRINPKITHYTTNKGSVIDPVSMTSARLDFYNRVQVDAKEDVGSGILKYHTIEHFTEPEKKQKQKDKISHNNKKMPSKKLEEMKVGELQMLAKSLGIKNPKKYKRKNTDKDTLQDLMKLIREKSPDVEEEEQKEFEEEDEEKYSEKSLRERERAMKEREERILETAEEDDDLVDMTLERGIGQKNKAQMILDKVADVPKSRRSLKLPRLSESQLKLISDNMTQENAVKFKKYYNQLNSIVNKKSLEDGSWVSKGAAALGAPEIAVLQAGVNAIGLGMSDKDKADWKKLLDGGELSGSRTAELALKVLINPDAWGSTITHQAKKEIARISNDWNDMVGKGESVYKGQEVSEEGVQKIIDEREQKASNKLEEERELKMLQGEDVEDSIDYKEGSRVTKLRKIPKLSDYGGRDDTSFGEKFNKFMSHFNPFSMTLPEGENAKYQRLLEELKARNPEGYARYMRDVERHQAFVKKNAVSGRNQLVSKEHKPLVSGFKDIIWESLKENSKLLKDGKEGFLTKEQVKQYYAIRNNTSNMSYGQLAHLYQRFMKDSGGYEKLPDSVKKDLMSWEIKQQNELGSKGVGDIALDVGSDVKAREDIEDEEKSVEQAKEDAKKEEEIIRQELIDKENEETIRKRAEVIHNGFVNTDNRDIPQLRPKIIFGNSDLQYTKDPEEVEEEQRTINKMLMWNAKNITEQNNPNNITFKRQQENERMRFETTFKMPRAPKGYGRIPESFLRYNEKIWIPVFPRKDESLPLMSNPERNQKPFLTPQPYRQGSTSMVEEIRSNPNMFPEAYLQNYKGKSIPNVSKNFNPWINRNFTIE